MASPIFAAAAAQYHSCRADYGIYLEGVYSQAHEVTNGVLLNARGKRKGVDAFSLFSGSDIRAYAYASEELVEWWLNHPRITFAMYERQWFEEPPD